ncbi:hypothetical protein QYE76_014587 [Lolium multiflorum]|uniref:Uncharacterized protein n=1 Tax=Lolium multiflorum TaxID=4521 RepID=A0AAD8U583_LOLMU|nr:hypothetical protein QYE76_014587 [Lolium multiflorum]
MTSLQTSNKMVRLPHKPTVPLSYSFLRTSGSLYASSPPLKKVIMQSQPISPKSAPKSKASSGPVAPRASTQARTAVRKVAARKTLKRKAPAQESPRTSTEETSSGAEESSQGDSSSGNSERSTTQSQTASPAPASKKRSIPEPPAPQAPTRSGSRTKRRCVKRARKNPRASPSSQEVSNVIISLVTLHANPLSFGSANHFLLQTEETSSGDVEEVPMPSATLDLATSTIAAAQVADLSKSTEKPIVTTSAVPPSLGEGCDLSSLLTFDPESIEPTSSKASGEPSPSTVHGPLQRLKDLLSSSTETLIENSEEVKGILEDIQPHLPMTLQVKLWPAVTLSVFKSRVQSARQRITLRHSQLRADIAEKCRRLNEKKAALDAKTDTSANRAELETLRKELESLEERVRMTKQLIHDKEALIARSEDEAKGLTADLKTDLAEIRTLSGQLVTGRDEDDEAEIAEVDRIRVDALHALDVFLQ